jgi:hypothetical protein
VTCLEALCQEIIGGISSNAYANVPCLGPTSTDPCAYAPGTPGLCGPLPSCEEVRQLLLLGGLPVSWNGCVPVAPSCDEAVGLVQAPLMDDCTPPSCGEVYDAIGVEHDACLPDVPPCDSVLHPVSGVYPCSPSVDCDQVREDIAQAIDPRSGSALSVTPNCDYWTMLAPVTDCLSSAGLGAYTGAPPGNSSLCDTRGLGDPVNGCLHDMGMDIQVAIGASGGNGGNLLVQPAGMTFQVPGGSIALGDGGDGGNGLALVPSSTTAVALGGSGGSSGMLDAAGLGSAVTKGAGGNGGAGMAVAGVHCPPPPCASYGDNLVDCAWDTLCASLPAAVPGAMRSQVCSLLDTICTNAGTMPCVGSNGNPSSQTGRANSAMVGQSGANGQDAYVGPKVGGPSCGVEGCDPAGVGCEARPSTAGYGGEQGPTGGPATATGGPGGPGFVAGGNGGLGHASGGSGGRGGTGGKGGESDYYAICFPFYEPPSAGGPGGSGGVGGTAAATGGRGGDSYGLPGKGGDATSSAGSGGTGGTGGPGGNGRPADVHCGDGSDPDVCHYESTGHEHCGAPGGAAGGPGGSGGATANGGGGGINLLTGVSAAPGTSGAAPGAVGQQGSPGAHGVAPC